MKNRLLIVNMFFFCSSVIFGMNVPQFIPLTIHCPVLHPETKKPQNLNSKIEQIDQEYMDGNGDIYEMDIEKIKTGDIIEYHLVAPNNVIPSIKLSEKDIILIKDREKKRKSVCFKVYDPKNSAKVTARIRVQKSICEKALSASISEPINVPAHQSIDDPVWNTRFTAPHKSVLQFEQTAPSDDRNGLNYIAQLPQEELQALYLSLKHSSKQAPSEHFSYLGDMHIKKQLSQEFIDQQIKNEADGFFQGRIEENKNAQNKYYAGLADALEKSISSLKIDNLAHEIIQHYIHHIECNDDLGRPTFEEYISTLQVIMRKKDHKKSGAQDSEGPLCKTFIEINNAAGPIIKDHQDLIAGLAKQKEQWNSEVQEEKDKIDQEIFDHKKSVLLVPLMQTTLSLASQEIGQMMASGLLSLVPNPELEKELTTLKEDIGKQEKKLKENVLEDHAKKHTEILFEQSQNRKKLLDGYNDQQKKPTQIELLQSLKDRHAKKCK